MARDLMKSMHLPKSIGIAILAALAVSLSLMLGGLVWAQDAGTMSYAENGEDPVYTFSAGDPEEVDTIVWSLVTNVETDDNRDIDGDGDNDVTAADVVDHPDFVINASGELSFMRPPNFEAPTGRNEVDNEPVNTYSVVVQASDGGSSNDAAEAMVFVTWFKATVRVTDVEEDGTLKVVINPADRETIAADTTDVVPLIQPQVDTIIGARLTDPDGPTPIPDADITWRWYRTSDLAQEGEVILNPNDTAEHDLATYTPRDRAGANDVNMYLRVKATYEDRRGRRKSAEAVSLYPVLAAIVNENTLPKFAATTAERRVNENVPKGTAVGRPVTANDPDDEKLSYSLVASTEGAREDDVSSFKINPETGQITVNGDLNFEPQEEGQQDYMFQVRATDSRAGSTGTTNPNIQVTVHITDLDESPEIVRPDLDSRGPMLIVHAGGNAIEHAENDETAIATYMITDDDEGTPDLSLDGDDAGMFTFRYDGATADPNNDAVLAFKAKPDFENPADQDEDNIYEVTLQADDGNSSPGTLDVTVKVTNVEEDGTVTLSHQQPLIGQVLTAMVEDSDGGFGPNGGLTRVEWMWERSVTVDAEGVQDCSADLPSANDTEWRTIPRVSVPNFTPRAIDEGCLLQVTATYLDRTYDYPHAPVLEADTDPAGMGFGASAQVVSGVVREDPANSKPDFPMDPVARFVPENTSGYKYVGDPVTANDADGDTLSYSLDGSDKSSFYIAVSDTADDNATGNIDEQALAGQIRVGVRTKLDHETDRQYDVEVDTTDSTSTNADAFDSTDVDIHVTNVDEKPDIWVNENGTRVMPNEGVFNVNYEEESADDVLTLMAEDPEGVRSIVWSLLTNAEETQDLGVVEETPDPDDVDDDDIADVALFEITSGGVLKFKEPRSYEVDSDSGAGDDAKIYRVVVQASDGGTTADGGTAPAQPKGFLNWFKVSVTVQQKDEDGEISFTPTKSPLNDDIVLLQPQVRVEINASLADDDGGVVDADIDWQWERRGSRSSQWEEIPNETDAEYIPHDSADTTSTVAEESRIDVGDRLRVKASYTDAEGAGKTWTEELPYPVLGAIVEENNSAPAFAAATAERSVDENALPGTAVGAPVTATDPDLERAGGANRKVTYWLDSAGADNGLFTIDPETGQIKVKTSQDFEAGGSAASSTDYTVSVMATDSSNVDTAPPLVVTIHLVDVDDAPEINLTPTADPATPAAPVRIEHEGGFAIERAEGNPGDLTVSTFTVEDDDGGKPALSLAGADESRFRIGAFPADAVAPATAENSGTLFLVSAPDFEAPTDGGSSRNDNVYEVTIVAKDGRNTTELDLTLKITNVDEDGEVSLEYQQPVIGRGLPASVTDPDGGFNPSNGSLRAEVTDVSWTWHRTADTGFEADSECLGGDVAWQRIMPTDIPSAGGPAYVPQGDMDPTVSDNTRCLRATARYIDRAYAYPDAPDEPYDHDDPGDWGFYKTEMVVSGVVRVTTENIAPVQNDAVRYVPEGTPRHKDVDDPVTASDPGDQLVYELGGTGAGSFYIAETMITDVDTTADRNEAADAGQIRVGARTSLDHEGQDAYMVEVTATDTYGASDSGDVTINVVDVDEAPAIMVGGLAISGPSSVDYAEDRTDAVVTYDAVGPDAAMATWTLEGDDAGEFRISNAGVLTFRISPDYENPADMGMDNIYMVTVKADDGTYDDTHDVTVTVTNVAELGMVSGDATADYAENGTEAVATYTADGPDAASATWSVSGADMGDFTISSSGVLTFNAVPNFEAPVDADTDNVYQVTVEADAGGETGMVAVTVTVTNVAELGVVSGDATADYAENDTEAVATYTADGPDAASATWSVSGADMGDFTISSSGVLTFNAVPNFEAPVDADTDNVYQVTVEADAGGETGMVAVTVTVTNVAELRMVSGDATADYAENDTEAVATYTADGPDAASATWSVSGADMGDFTISSSGVLTFNAVPNFEAPVDADTNNVYQVTVEADAGGETGMVAVTVTVTNVNEPPEFPSDIGARSVAENTAAGANIGDPVAATDADADDTLAYTLGGADMDSFDIDPGTGQLMTKDALDYETKASYDVTVTATDRAGLADTITVTIMVTDVDENEAPEFPSATADRSVPENTATGEPIGAPLAATDPNEDTLTYALEGDDAASFSIDPATGQLLTSAQLDRTTKSTYTVIVRATDDGGLSDTITVTITVTDVENQAPGFPFPMEQREIAENTAAGEDIGDPVAATDGDDDTLTYALGGADMADFDIDTATGQLSTKTELDHETKDTYTVTVTATDGNGGSDEVTVTVMVTNVDEEGTVTLSMDMPQVGAEITASLTDPDGGVTGDTWQWASSDAMDGAYTDIDGATDASYTPVADDENMYLRATVTYTDGEGSGKSEMATTNMAVTSNQPPAFDMDTTSRDVAENSAAGANVGAPVAASDPDQGDMLAYTLGGADMASFDIDNMGQITVGEGTMLDYEAEQKTYMVTVTATDTAGETASIDVTINVTNVADTLLERYDDNDSGDISKDEAIDAINDYLYGVGEDAITRDQAIEVLNLYLYDD